MVRELLLIVIVFVIDSASPFSFRQQRTTISPLPTATTSPSTTLPTSPTPPTTFTDVFYKWKNNYNIHYVDVGDAGPPLVFVPGFGVGTFHYDHQLEQLSKKYRVLSFDLLGQGQSWPTEGEVKEDDKLCYSADFWLEQVIDFIENICQEPVHLAGNSLGGYLSLAVAAQRPDLVKSLVLLNAAPFWSFAAPREGEGIPPTTFPGLLWDGVLPAPKWILNFGSRYFDIMRNPNNVNAMLRTVYATPAAFDQKLIQNIIEAANRLGGQEAFTSILFSPKMKESFDEMLDKVDCPTCLVYGKEDPWIVPYWGQKAKKRKPDIVYYEISPSGHCPHHETPTAANAVISAWVDEMEDAGPNLLPHGRDKSEDVARMAEVVDRINSRVVGRYREEVTGIEVEVSVAEGQPRTFFERLAAAFGS